MNAYLGNADSRHEWTSLYDSKRIPVAELTAQMDGTGVAVARSSDGETLLQYLAPN